MEIDRPDLETRLRARLRASPAVALLGPRQCGKTTLARRLAADRSSHYFDLEHPADLARLDEPFTALARLKGLIVIDEVQRRPDLFPTLRVLLDRKPLPARILVLGSASPDLLRQASESLAGRIAFVEMGGFTLDEVGTARLDRLWNRGGFPRSFLARSQRDSVAWRRDFVQTFLERDLPQLGVRVPALTMRRFWTMLAHYSGGLWNSSEVGRSLGEAHTTIRRHLETLAGAMVVRVLQPWHANLDKRQVKAPKVYVRDTGLLHQLLGIESQEQLAAHPKLGASWEGFVIEQILAATRSTDAYFWRTATGAELDLLLIHGGRRVGVEVKYSDAPRFGSSMATAMQDLELDRLLIVYPGEQTYDLGAAIQAMPLPAAIAALSV
jgi:predicted AAA+ superfamily ATPase